MTEPEMVAAMSERRSSDSNEHDLICRCIFFSQKSA
jgi:hypothetical protein